MDPNKEDIDRTCRISEEHDQAVNPNAPAACGGESVFQAEVLM